MAKGKRNAYRMGPNLHPCLWLPCVGVVYFIGVAVCIAFFPVTLPWTASKLKKDIEEEQKHKVLSGQRRSTQPPRGFRRSKRRQAMSFRHRRKTKNAESPASQERCALLCLPYEIRQLIWKECLAGCTIHLNNHGHTRCTPANVCNQGHLQSSIFIRNSDAKSQVNPISMFLTCRQIYSEAAHYFYSGNIFTTSIADNIEFLPRLLPRNRIDAIRSLRFVWTILGDPPFTVSDWKKRSPGGSSRSGTRFKRKMWVTTWASLAGMKNLRDLRITLDVDRYKWQRIDNWQEIEVLEPLMSVTTPQFFELVVPMARKPDNGPWEALPCAVRRREILPTYCFNLDGPDLILAH